MNQNDIKKVAQIVTTTAGLLDIPEKEAEKAMNTPRDKVRVTQKIALDNFYKLPAFWVAIGTAIAGAATGDYFHAAGAVASLFGISIGGN